MRMLTLGNDLNWQRTSKKWAIRFAIGLLLGVAAFMSYLSMGIAPLWVAIMVGLGAMLLSVISQKFGAFPKSKWGIGLTIVLGVGVIIVSALTLGGVIPALSAAFMKTHDVGHWVLRTKDAGHFTLKWFAGYSHAYKVWISNVVTVKEWVPQLVQVLSISKEAIVGIAVAVSSIGPIISGVIRGVEKIFKVSEKKPIKTYSRHSDISANEFGQGRKQGRSYARSLRKIGSPNRKQGSNEDNETDAFISSTDYKGFSPMTELNFTFPSQGGRGVEYKREKRSFRFSERLGNLRPRQRYMVI